MSFMETGRGACQMQTQPWRREELEKPDSMHGDSHVGEGGVEEISRHGNECKQYDTNTSSGIATANVSITSTLEQSTSMNSSINQEQPYNTQTT